METKIQCTNPACQQKLVVDETYWGRSFHCPACGTLLHLPAATPHPRLPQSPVRMPLPEETPAPLRVRLLRLGLGWSAGAVAFLVLMGVLHVHRQLLQIGAATDVDKLAGELAAPGGLLDLAPVANHQGNRLLYARETGQGVGLFLANLALLERKPIEVVPRENTPPRLIGWSPDDRYLAFAAPGKNRGPGPNQQIMIRDGATGAALNSVELTDALERGAWLSTNSLIFLSVRRQLFLYNLDGNSLVNARYGGKGLNSLPFGSNMVAASLVPAGGSAVAYDDGGNLKWLNLLTGRVTPLTHLTNAVIGQLDYSPDNQSFLFSLATAGRRSDPCLYRFDPRTNAATGGLAQFTDRYNFERINYGYWLAEGAGLAYAGPNFIGVTLNNGAFHTNLFSGGAYRNFSVSPRGDKIFALASVAQEPPGIWEYDVNDGDLDNVVPPKEQLELSQWAEPVAMEIVRKTGGDLHYALLAPPESSGRGKYPAVLNLLGDNPYDAWPQLLANAGIISVSRHPRSAGEAQAIAEHLLSQPQVDARRFYLVGQWGDTDLIQRLLETIPGRCRGVVLLRPSNFPQFPAQPRSRPPFLVFAGFQGDLVYALRAEQFLAQACQRQIPAQLFFDEDLQRLAPRADLGRERDKMIIEFIRTGVLK